jgi:hypothetical protein
LALRIPDAADRSPGVVIEIGIEPRQNDGALRQLCHGVQELCGRRHRTGRACRNHRPVMVFAEPRGFGVDQEIAPRCRLDFFDLGKIGRPCHARDAQKVERMLPVFVELVRHQAVERAPVDAARHHVVDQPRQIGGQG